MQAIGYYLFLPFIYFVSILPFSVLYLISDVLYFIIYYVIGYRKKVVIENLTKSFPEKSTDEINQIAKNFYSYFCDLFFETFKTLTISPADAVKRCSYTPEALALFNTFHRKKKNILIVAGHHGNWEWAGNTFSLMLKSQLYVIYHPLANKYFNNLIYRMRTRFGTKLIEKKSTYKNMVRDKHIISATAFIADQTPAPESAFWTKFLNQYTPVFRGTEKIAKKLNYSVVFVTINRVKRGYYVVKAETLFENPATIADDQVSEAHTRRLEEEIIKQPEIWLWSHRRWKHKQVEKK